MEVKNKEIEILEKYFPNLSKEQILQFQQLQGLYAEWNQKINVISRKDMGSFYEHHVLHSLAIASQFNFPSNYKILDLGAGGGFPGVPLAIFFPEVNFCLVDSIHKKLKVVNEIAAAIGLKNVTTMHSRVEDIADQIFDAVVSRAVAPLKQLMGWSKPLLKSGNNSKVKKDISGLICLKGGDLSNEIKESGCHPKIWEIEQIFDEPYFKEKYILNVR